MSVGVAYAQGQSTVSINEGNSCKNQDYKNFDDVEIVETSDTQDDNLNNKNLVLNEIGYKVPAEHDINKR